MDTRIYNIDSKFRNKTTYPNAGDYVFNNMDQTVGSNYVIEPFNEKNVIELRISSFEIPATIYYIQAARGNNVIGAYTVPNGSYTRQELIALLNANIAGVTFTYSSATGKVTIQTNGSTTLTLAANTVTGSNYDSLGELLGFTVPQTIAISTTTTGTSVMGNPSESYFFVRINDYGNIINKNRRYVAKVIPDYQGRFDDINQETINKIITNTIKFDQPIDISNLRITLEDEYGQIINTNGSDYSFSLELVIITNSILKNYDEIRFYNEKVMNRILTSKMLAYYEKQVDKKVNDTLTSTYTADIVNLNNMQEYNPFGSRNNYAPMFSFYGDIEEKK
jgi:hypothetical protein